MTDTEEPGITCIQFTSRQRGGLAGKSADLFKTADQCSIGLGFSTIQFLFGRSLGEETF